MVSEVFLFREYLMGPGFERKFTACRAHSSFGFVSMSDSDDHAQVRGRPFAKGNPGRRPGSTNERTRLAEALLRDEEEALIRKGIELAKAGDARMLKFFLERSFPKQRTIQVDVPAPLCASDTVDALWAILDAVASGQISPNEGVSVASIVGECAQAIAITDLEIRMTAIETKLKGGG